MKFTFYGGAEEIGSLGLVIELNGNKLLFDYGITPNKPPAYPLEAPNVDAIFLSHAHLDHSGMVPYQSNKYNVPVYLTEVTRELSRLLFYDSVKIAELEGYLNPYSVEDLERIEQNYNVLEYRKTEIIDNFEMTGYDAGHIPGSTMFLIESNSRILFTGDLQTVDTELLKGTRPVYSDILFIESTYAGAEHPSRTETEKSFIGKIEEVLDRKGKAIIPSFAVGRTQELMLVLKKMDREFYVDGMGNTVNGILSHYPGFIKDPAAFKKVKSLAKMVRNKNDRKKAMENGVIVTTSGMLEGGPVIGYISHIYDNPKSAIMFTGFQVEGTNGRMLLDTGIIDFYGTRKRVDAEILRFDFSAHASNSELLKFIDSTKAENVILFHGTNREKLAKNISKNVILPKKGETFELKI